MTKIEEKTITIFNLKYGIEKYSRCIKVIEEFNEMIAAFDTYISVPNETSKEHLKDEIADLYATVSHLASTFNLYHEELLQMTLDKIKERDINPEYKHNKNINISLGPELIPEELVEG